MALRALRTGSLWLGAAVALGVACAPAAPGPAPTPEAPPAGARLGEEFRLQPGQRVDVDGLGPLVFVRVVEDSRCPTDVTCAWEGEAVVVLAVGESGEEMTAVKGAGQEVGSTAEAGGYRVALVSVEPHPVSTRTIEASDYRIGLVVTEAEAATDLAIQEVAITSVEVLMLQSFPYRVQAAVTGYFPDGCTRLHEVRQERTGEAIIVRITSQRPRELYCTQAIVPYEATIPLEGAFTTGNYTVTVNGVKRTFNIP